MKFPIRNECYSRVGFGSPKRFFFAPFREIFPNRGDFPRSKSLLVPFPRIHPLSRAKFWPQRGEMRSVDFPSCLSWPSMASWRRNQGAPPCESNHSAKSNEAAAVCCVIKPYKEAAPAETLGSPLAAGPSPAECTALVCVPRSESTERNDTKTNFPPTRRRENALGENWFTTSEEPLAHRVLRFGRRGSSSIG